MAPLAARGLRLAATVRSLTWSPLRRLLDDAIRDASRAVVEKGRFEALFKRETSSTVRLHLVGENGEAYLALS